MSGIAGAFFLDGSAAEETTVARMLGTMRHRGPDGQRIWANRSIGLGHLQLRTTPESAFEHQPLVAKQDGHTIAMTADLRLDHREELAEALRVPHDSTSDADLLLASWRRWGSSCVDHVDGDFAFVIWNEKTRTLFCARDRFGVRSFFYHIRPGRMFLFATEIKGLLALSELVPRRLNDRRIGEYLANLNGFSSFYSDIETLPAAHTLSVDYNSLRIERYWSLDQKREVLLESDAEYAEAFRAQLTRSVVSRLRSSKPLGAHLSGGLDSSAIACLARDHLPTPLHTFSLTFRGIPACDERRFIEPVLRQDPALVPHMVPADEISPLADLPLMLHHLDEPFRPNTFLPWALNKAAAKKGIRVVLDGFDGDTTVSHGHASLAELLWKRQLPSFVQQTRALALREQRPAHSVIRQSVLPRLVPSWIRQFRSNRIPSTIKRSFAKRLALRRLAVPAWPRPNARYEHWRLLTRALFTELAAGTGLSAAAFGIESRSPFLDRRLVELCLAFPGHQKLRDGWTRFVMRQSLKDLLPAEVCWRVQKSNVAPAVQIGLLKYEKNALERIVNARKSPLEPYVEMDGLRANYGRYRAGDNSQLPFLWRALVLCLWLEHTGLTVAARI